MMGQKKENWTGDTARLLVGDIRAENTLPWRWEFYKELKWETGSHVVMVMFFSYTGSSI